MAADSLSLNFLPRPLKKALLDFQKQGVRFGISKQGRCLIGDEMGLGKTLQALSIAYYYRDAWPLLIIVPSSVKFSWIDEVEKWLPEVEPHDLNLIRSGIDVSNLSQRRIHIIGYGLLSRNHTSDLLLKAIEAQRFQVIIMDESHYLKNKRTKRTQRLYQISKKAKHVVLLSGTPSLARPEELYIQLDIVCPGLFGSFTKFADRYCDRYKEFVGVGNCHMKWNTRGASNLNELYQLLRKHVMIRRLKKEVLTQLPPKRRQKIMFDVSQDSKHMKELKSIKNDFKKCSAIMKGESRDNYSVASPLVEMNRLSTLMYHYTGLVKIVPIQEYVTNLIDNMNGKVIVFFRHRLVMKGIIQRLVYKKVKYICICGDVSSSIRGDLVRQFQTDPQTRAAVLSIEAASFGLTLTAAHHVVFAELHYTPGIIIQAEDRAHRIGQTLPVNVHYLIARGTLDETMWAMIRRKVYVTSHTLDGKCKELQMENGDQEQSQRLSACAAWIQDQDENDNDDSLEEFVMEQLSSMTVKKDHSQRDLRTFFSPAPSSSIDGALCNRSAKSLDTDIVEEKPLMQMDTEPVCVLDSDDDLCGCTKLENNTLTEKAPCSGGYEDGILQTPENSSSEELQTTGDLHRNNDTPYSSRSEKGISQAPENSSSEELQRTGDFHRNKSTSCSSRSEKGICKAPENSSSEELQTTGDRDVNKNTPSKAKSLKNENQCQIKPKMLKFKKVKDGKLYLSSSKPKSEQMKRKIGSGNHVDFVGNDPETDSQVLQTYVDNADKIEREKDGDVDEKIVDDATAHVYCKEERSFFASLRDAGTDYITGLYSTATVPQRQINRGQTNMDGSEKQGNCGRKRKWLQKNSLCKDLFYSRTKDEEGSDSNNENLEDNEQSYGEELSRSQTCLEQRTASFPKITVGPKKTVDEADAQTVLYPNQSACDGYLNGRTLLVTGKNESRQSSSNRLSAGKKQTRWKEKDGRFIDSSIPCSDGCAMIPQPGECDVQTETDNHNGDSSDEFENSKSRIIQRPPPSPPPPLIERRKGRRKKSRRKLQRTAQLPKKRAIREEPSWSCNACTFINDGQLMECSICFTPRSTEPASPSCITASSGSHEGVLCDKASQSTSISPDINSVCKLCSTIEDRTPRSFENVRAASVGTEDDGVKLSSDNYWSSAVGQTAAHGNSVETSHKFTDETLDCNKSSSVICETAVSTENENYVSNVETTSLGLSSTPVGQVEASDPRGPPPWSCSMCTFLNEWQMIECSLCLTPRRRSQRRSAREWSAPANKRQSRKTNSSTKRVLTQGNKHGGNAAAEEMPTDCEKMVVGENRSGFLVSSAHIVETDETDQKSRYGPVNVRSCGLQSDRDSLSYALDPCTNDVNVSKGGITSPDSPIQSGSEVTCAVALSPVSSDESNSLKCQPKKRLKLDVTCTNGTSEDPCDISDVFDDFDKESRLHGMPLVTSSPEVVDSMDVSCSESLPTDLLSVTNTSLHRKEETVEELKAAAVEFFSSSDWEDDDLWWEDDSSSGQSSLPCSRETESPSNGTHRPSFTPGFEKCSDLFSLTDLQNKSLSPQQSETNTNRPSTIDNVFNDRKCHTETGPCNSTADVYEVEDEELLQPPEPMKLKFCLSFYTDRVYLYNEDAAPLNVNFFMSDLKNRNTDDLPLILHHEYNLKQAKKFLHSWSRMGECKRRVLRKSALIVDDPLLGYESARQGKNRGTSYVRHPSQKSRINKVIDTAEQVGGNVCIVSKPGNPEDKRRRSWSTGNNINKVTEDSNTTPSDSALWVISSPESMGDKANTCYQAFTTDGTPLCLFCGGPVNFGDGVHCSAWDKRFCSYDCKQEYQVLVSGTAVRRNLFELERGICQICRLNAHEIYNSVKALPVRERPALLAGSVYSSLPPQTLKRMVMDPNEGMFWEADHIKPVAEGGGECGLDNYRTLCVMCHRKATEELNKRTRQKKSMQESANCLNITTFFRPLS